MFRVSIEHTDFIASYAFTLFRRVSGHISISAYRVLTRQTERAGNMIYPEKLTAADRKEISDRYAPFHNFAEFWTGFTDYQKGRSCPHGWSNSRAGQSWDRGAEAAMWIINRKSRAALPVVEFGKPTTKKPSTRKTKKRKARR